MFLLFTVPGVVALYIRAQFLSGKVPSASEGIISYVTVSLVYQASVFPIAKHLYHVTEIDGLLWAKWVSLIFLGPAILGLLLGLNIRKGWTKRLVNFFGINTIHPVGCAWDWKFAHCEECWGIVTLKDGTKWYGYIGTGSFMSSEPSERDFYMTHVYEMAEDGKPWSPKNSSVWIAHGEIQSLEFLPR